MQVDFHKTGMCGYVLGNRYYERFSLVEWCSNLIHLLPIVAFLALNEPHDCYTCLGKDPDRIFSQFQLTIDERKNRKYLAKFSRQKQSFDTRESRLFSESFLLEQQSSKRRLHSIVTASVLSQKQVGTEEENSILAEAVYRAAGSPSDPYYVSSSSGNNEFEQTT